MNRIVLILILASAAANASATGWPAQSSTEEQLNYCRGFVTGGLASKEVGSVSRVDLWLAWSYVIRSGAMSPHADGQEYQTGRDQFKSVATDADAQSIIQHADRDCGLGRSGHQVTGW